MASSAPNPFAPASPIQDDSGVFGEARLLKKGFLHRVIQFNALTPRQPQQGIQQGDRSPPENPHEQSVRCPIANLTYNGWWFVQRVHVDGNLVWWAISWHSIERSIEVAVLPGSTEAGLSSDLNLSNVKIEIDFARGLKIRRFRVWVDQEIRYDEIC